MKNYSDTIKSKSERTLTAKGYSFVWKCIDIVAEQKGLCRYDQNLKETKEKIKNVLIDLLIDKEMSINQIKDLIKSRSFLKN